MHRRNRNGGLASPWTAALIVGVVALGLGGIVASRNNRARTQTPISYRAPLTPYSNVAPNTGATPGPATTTPTGGGGMSSSTSTGSTGATGTGRTIGTTGAGAGTTGAGVGAPGVGDGTTGAGAGTTGAGAGTTGAGAGATGAGAGTTGPGAGTTSLIGATATCPGPTGTTGPSGTTGPNGTTGAPGTTGTAAPTRPSATPPTVAGEGAMETQMLGLVNAERSRAGLPALTADPQLMRIARTKSQDMVSKNYFSHQSPTYGSPFDMLRTFGVSYRAAGENIALNQSTPAAHTSLMNSSGHRANILGRQYTKVGIGVVRGSRGLYFTQEFTG